MQPVIHAILAGVLMHSSACIAASAFPLQQPVRNLTLFTVVDVPEIGQTIEPLHVRFTLHTDQTISGYMVTWDQDGFSGDFGRYLWHELNYREAWNLFRRVMEPESGEQWLVLGRIQLRLALDEPSAAGRAERAFRAAVARDAALADRVDTIRESILEIEHERRQRKTKEQTEQLRTGSPEARDWPASPWPEITPAERHRATLAMRADGERLMELVGLDVKPIESAHFLLFADLPRPEAIRWIHRLEETHREFEAMLGLAPGTHIFWGKAVVLITRERDHYETIQEEGFGHAAAESVSAMCHPVGSRVFVNLHRVRDENEFGHALIRQSVHGLMHSFLTPRRPPAWANEGIPEYIASRVMPESWIVKDRRRRALRFIREGGDVPHLLGLTYGSIEDGAQAAILAGVGGLLIEFMHRERPQRFAAWLRTVKAGKSPRDALRQHYRAEPAALIDMFVRYHRVND